MVRILSKSRRYIDELRELMSIKDKNDQRKIYSLYDTRKKLIKRRDRYNLIRAIFYIALYASLISSFTSIFNLLPWISRFLDFFLTYIGILGTTFSLIIILILSHSIRNYDRDVATIESHILSIYVKYDSSKPEYFDMLLKKIK
ncbi:MAG: hypothetical protein ACP5NV_03195 [Candidatus Woesearchaeota archaeon]